MIITELAESPEVGLISLRKNLADLINGIPGAWAPTLYGAVSTRGGIISSPG